MKSIKKIIMLVGCALCASIATAEIGMYGRLDLGVARRKVPGTIVITSGYGSQEHQIETETKFNINAFNLMPAFGIMFAPNSDNVFTRGLGLEVQLDLNFGGNKVNLYKQSAAVINPGVMAMWHYYMPKSCSTAVQKIVPYVGLGFSVPISIVKVSMDTVEAGYGEVKGFEKTHTKAGFDVNFRLGCGYEVIPALMLTLDYDLSVGTSLANSVSIGAVWKFSGRRTVAQVGE